MKGTKRRNPITGKMEIFTPRPAVDLITPRPVPEGAAVTFEVTLAGLRKEWASLTTAQRAGPAGDKLMRSYRHNTLGLTASGGSKPPPIYDDM